MKQIHVLVIFLMLLVFLSGCTVQKEIQKKIPILEPDKSQETSKDSTSKTSILNETEKNQDKTTEGQKTQDNVSENQETQLQISPNTVLILYSANLGKQTSGVSNFDVSEGELYTYIGTGTPITWDTEYRAILGTIPTLNKTYNFYRITSPSYAQSYLYLMTKNNKLFILRDWGYPEETEIKDIIIIDPKKPEIKDQLSIYPAASSDIAIVGNSIFYTNTIGYKSAPSLTGYTEVRSSGGDLYKLDIGSTQSKKLLDYSDSDNTGMLYGIGDNLASVYLNPDTNEYEFRVHDINTGKVSEIFYRLPNVPDLWVYGGETAFYVVLKVPDQPSTYQIHQLKLNGETKLLLNIELDSDSHYIEGVDQVNNQAFISVAKAGVIDEIAVYGLEDDSFNTIPLDPDISLLHPPSKGDRFIILNPN
ncbi:MAG: hypothetical protein Q7S22_03585 [Candidatus Micrarchaeota archaeon]|nr:hypothetical protein [Candidatus Micrarchaeota archaeon]